MISTILWALVGGTIIGLLGKMAAPGDKSHVPLWLTVVCGIGGIVVGNFLYTLFFAANTPGFDWWRHAWQIVAAAILVSVAAGATGRAKTSA